MLLTDLYLRLSDGRNENGSFVQREDALRNRASQLGWKVRNVVIENDVTGAKSASAFKRRKVKLADGSVVMRVWRPGFQSILGDLKSGAVQAILAEDLDRAMRDPRDAEDLIDVMQERKAWADSLSGSLKFTNGGTDSEITMARLMVAMAWKSSRDTARRVSQGRERQVLNGTWGGGIRPYGFTPVPNPNGNHQNTVLVVREEESKEIERASNQLLAGVSLKAITRDMISRKVPTVTGVHWSAQTVRDVLLRDLNTRILHEDVHKAVVAILSDPSRSQPGRAPTWLGTNIYHCVCGSPMKVLAGTKRAAAYICARKGGQGEVHVRRKAADLDGFIADLVIARLSQDDGVHLFAKPQPQVNTKALRAEADALKEIMNELARDRAEGLITREQLLSATVANRTRLEAVEATLASVTARSPLEGIVDAGDVGATWAKASLGQKREILRTLMTIRVLPTKRGERFDPECVQVDWR